MADEETGGRKVNPPSAPTGLDLTDPNMKASYANYTYTVINSTDVDLYFGTTSDGLASSEPVKFNHKITLNHASFVHMMEYWFVRYDFLKSVFGEGPYSLDDADAETVRAAFAKMRSMSNGEDPD